MSDLTPYPYQIVGAEFLQQPGAILADQVGLGKTLTSILAAQRTDVHEILVVVPLSLKPQWVAEIIAVEQALASADIEVEEWTQVWAITTDGLVRHWTLAHYQEFQDGKNKKTPSDAARAYLKQTWDAVILDEAHKIKGRNSQRTRWIKKLRSTYRWGLTGTPMAEYPPDVWSLLNWVAPKQFPYYWPFVNEYCEVDEYRKVVQMKHVKVNGRWTPEPTLQKFQATLAPYILARKLEDVGIELPPQTINDVPLQMDETQALLYWEVQREILLQLTVDKTLDSMILDLRTNNHLLIQNTGARFTHLHKVASNPAVFRPGTPNIKMDWLEEYVEGGGEPALVFSRYRATVDMVTAFLAERNQKGWLVGTWDGLGTGHNLQRFTHTIAWDLPFPLLTWEQGKGRTYRMGQDKPTRITRLIVQGSVDQRVAKRLDHKQAIVDMLIDWLRGTTNTYVSSHVN